MKTRIALGCGLLAFIVLVGLFVFVRSLGHPLPDGQTGPEADALAREMMAAVKVDSWEATGAVAWDFGGRQQHLWDRERGLARVRWDDHEVLVDLATRDGRAWTGGEEVTDAGERAALLEQAWAHWANDSFWLNPIAKLFDDGVERRVVDLPDVDTDGGTRGLLVTYTSGGVTPGDSYLWIVGDDGLPTAWRMWTQILPIQGIETSWEDWTELPTGALVARKHRIVAIDLVLSDIRAAVRLDDLEGGPEDAGDPFAPIAK